MTQQTTTTSADAFDAVLRAAVETKHPNSIPRFIEANGFSVSFPKYLTRTRFATADTRAAGGGTLVEALQIYIASTQTSLGRRAATLYIDTIVLTNRRQLHASMLTLRALLEVVAALVHFETRVTESLTAGIRTQADLDALMNHFKRSSQGSRFDWQRWWLDVNKRQELIQAYSLLKKSKDAPKSGVEALNVMTMIEHLDAVAATVDPNAKGRVHVLYAMLSDMCHPAVGGDILFVDPEASPGFIGHLPAPHDDVFHYFLATVTLPALCDIARLAQRSFHRLSHVAQTLQVQ